MLFVLRVLKEFVTVEQPIKVWLDNNCARKYCTYDVCSDRTKHWDVDLKLQVEYAERGIMEYLYIPSEDNSSDIHTKPTAAQLFKKHRTKMGIY